LPLDNGDDSHFLVQEMAKDSVGSLHCLVESYLDQFQQ